MSKQINWKTLIRENSKGFDSVYRDLYPLDNVIRPLNNRGHIHWSLIKYTIKQQKQGKNKSHFSPVVILKANLHRSLMGQDEGCWVTFLLCYPLKSYSLVCISVFARRLNPWRWLIMISRQVFRLFLFTTWLPMNQYLRSLLVCLFLLSMCLCSLRGDCDKISEQWCERKWLIRWGFAVSRGGGQSLVSTFVISFQPAFIDGNSRWF